MPLDHVNPTPTGRTGDVSDQAELVGVGSDPQLLEAEPNFELAFVHWPGTFEVQREGFAEPTIVHELSARSLEPGVAGVKARKKTDSKASTRWFDARKRVEERGGVWIDPYEHTFLKAVKCRSRRGLSGRFFFPAWVRLKTIPGAGTRQVSDVAAYNTWRAELARLGVLPAPMVEQLQPLVTAAQSKVDRLRADRTIQPGVREELLAEAEAELNDTVAAVRRALGVEGETTGTAATSPKPRRSRKPPAEELLTPDADGAEADQ